MPTLETARRRLPLNIVSNIVDVVIASLVGIWFTPFLIGKLGVAVYGLIPMVTSVAAYFGLVSQTISSSVGRFVALSLNKDEEENGRIYFNSAFFGLLVLCAIAFFPFALFSLCVPVVFDIPRGYESACTFLFLIVLLTSIVSTLTSPFLVASFVTHSFFLQNLARIGSRLVQVGIVAGLFLAVGPMLEYVGFGLLGSSVFLFVVLFYLNGRLTPQLRLDRRRFRFAALKEMGGMGAWMVVDRLGQLLYLNTDLIIINLFLGAEETGFYAPILQLVMLMRVFTPAISGVFAPIAVEYIARDRLAILAKYTRQSIKFMSLLLALPIGLLCGFSRPVLEIWLGPQFVHLAPLAWFLLAPHILFLAVNPLYNINRGMNKVKIPAVATLLGGLINILVSVALVINPGIGLYGVAVGTVVSFALRNLLFHSIYTAANLAIAPGAFLRAAATGLLAFIPLAFSGLLLERAGAAAGLLTLAVNCLGLSLAYLPLCYFLLLDREDRAVIGAILARKKAAAA